MVAKVLLDSNLTLGPRTARSGRLERAYTRWTLAAQLYFSSQQQTSWRLRPPGHLWQHLSISQNQLPLLDRLELLCHNQVAALCCRTALSREEGKERLDPYEEAQHLALCTSAEEAIQSVKTLGGAPLAALATALWREAWAIFSPVPAVQNGESRASLLP